MTNSIIDKIFVEKLFSNLETNHSKEFFKNVIDNVRWQVMGTHPLAGIYNSKTEFLAATFQRLNKILREGVILKVKNIIIEGNTAAIEMKSLSTAKNGKPFNNEYCWIVEFDDNRMIKKVTAYLDSALVQKTIDESQPHPLINKRA